MAALEDSSVPYEAPKIEEIEDCGDPIKTSPIVSVGT
jgi:hypothetical protein